jgi:Tol biopolymer transport system component
VKLVGPGEPFRLTTDPAADDWPAWSPDGRLIAFMRFTSEILADIFVIPALGGAERKVATVNLRDVRGRYGANYGWTGNLAWTPDGKWLVFGGAPGGDETRGIWMVALNGSDKRRLTTASTPNFGDWAPAFSSDGRSLAFIRERTLSDTAVYVTPLSNLSPTGPPQKVGLHANALGLAWKPDGSGLLASSAPHLGLSRMYSVPFRARLPADDRDARLLSFGERARGISVARTGRVVYAAQFRDANIWRLALFSQDRPVPAPIAASTLDEQTPDYSPDGKRLAFASTRSGVEEIFIANADGSNPMQITSMGGPQCSNPRWSPDGRLILFNSRRDGSADLYLLAPDTGELHRITTHPAEEFEPRWSRDGKTIYFGSNRTGRSEVWRMPATGGEPVQITKQGGTTATESPDGRYL